ncbi:hypothetical protein CLV35_2258 [Motilibacter peucedani]|uniref:Uncharacterized protein n=1 Tax=Motilibacter peucedani TaxID=598650 RepID=A0A420XNJ6_9ACTN|nr:hypothetical protein [Motilibacter peucedani]RKS73767.1 hypothetical protein CLV35_2258 [Motilibacter peucedani]
MPELPAFARRAQQELWDRRRSPAVGAAGLALVFVVAWIVKDLIAGTSVLHAVLAGVFTGAIAGVIYWVVLRAVNAVGDR